ncbi:serine protease [Nocardia sp. NPDC057440]|uniref:serine protease n=1 Tax=Nocardia sp. NPDC057440 TaxID=3346134 RepID=UPI0036708D3C
MPVAPAQAITGGTSVTDNSQFPYMVAVLLPRIMCGGALVDLEHVVTSAACVDGLFPSQVTVHAGSNRYYTGGVTAKVATISVHPNYNKHTYDSDIAVLTLSSALTAGPSIAPIPIPAADSGYPAADTLGVITGFGAVDSAYTLSDYLQQAHIVTYSLPACLTMKPELTSNMMCAGDPESVKDACPDDSGSPLAVEGVLVGVYSLGSSCGLDAPNPSSPLFTRVSNFTTWITTRIADSP